MWGALSGMEVSLAAAARDGRALLHARGRAWAAAAALGLAVLARPEAACCCRSSGWAGPLTWRRACVGLPVAGLLAPWVAFNFATTGTPLPATASAKIEGGLIGLLAGAGAVPTALLPRPWRFETEWVRWLFSVDALLPLLLLPGLWGLGRHVGRAALAPASVLVLHPLGMALLAPYRGPAFQEGRYSIHLLPLAIAVAVAPICSPPRSGARARAGSEVRGRLDGSPVPRSSPRLAALPSAATRYGWAVQNIDAMQVQLGRWVARHTPPTARSR